MSACTGSTTDTPRASDGDGGCGASVVEGVAQPVVDVVADTVDVVVDPAHAPAPAGGIRIFLEVGIGGTCGKPDA